ncbi:MAG: glycosyltransferase [Ketobacteraceae bacterium]|nr:glycosyltransferase [Ketobacteraceae bacterium]
MTGKALLTWELGAGLGHLACLYAVSRELQQKGFQVCLAVKDVSGVHHLFTEVAQYKLLQAPVWLPKIRMQRPVSSMADLLLTKGYLEPPSLNSLVRAWRSVFSLTQPDLIVANYSPTALLASFASGIPRMVVGTGIGELAPGQPLAPWKAGEEHLQRVRWQEQELLKLVKAALKSEREVQSLAYFSDIYQCEATILTCLPAFDLYERSPDVTYALLPGQQQLPAASWPDNSEANVLVYLPTSFRQVEPLLAELARVKANTVIVCPGLKGLPDRAGGKCKIYNYPVDMEPLMAAADLFISHGAMASTCSALRYGVPVCVLPLHLENNLIGSVLEKSGAGYNMAQSSSDEPFSRLVERLLNTDRLKTNCREFWLQQSRDIAPDFSACIGAALHRLGA